MSPALLPLPCPAGMNHLTASISRDGPGLMQRGLLVSLGKIRLFFDSCPSRNLGETHLKTQFRFRLFHSGTLGKSVTSLNLWNRYSILVLIPCIVVKTRSVRSILCPSAPSCVSPHAWMASVRSPDPTVFSGSQALVSTLCTSRPPVPHPTPKAGLQPIPTSAYVIPCHTPCSHSLYLLPL